MPRPRATTAQRRSHPAGVRAACACGGDPLGTWLSGEQRTLPLLDELETLSAFWGTLAKAAQASPCSFEKIAWVYSLGTNTP